MKDGSEVLPVRVLRRIAADDGQAMLELALVLPVLLLVLLGIVDFGRVMSTNYVVQHAARDAVRYASIGDDDTKIGQVVQTDTASIPSGVTWSVNPSGSRVSNDSVQVTVSAPTQIFDPILVAFLGQTYTSTATVTMRVE